LWALVSGASLACIMRRPSSCARLSLDEPSDKPCGREAARKSQGRAPFRPRAEEQRREVEKIGGNWLGGETNRQTGGNLQPLFFLCTHFSALPRPLLSLGVASLRPQQNATEQQNATDSRTTDCARVTQTDRKRIVCGQWAGFCCGRFFCLPAGGRS